jgi:hypothetical protein
MKKYIVLLLLLNFTNLSNAQNDCEMNTSELESLVERKYANLPMDGAKYVTIGNCNYIIGVGTTSTQSKTTSVMARISSVKARREILLLLNSTSVTSEAILTTEQIVKDDSSTYFESFKDEIVEKSSAFVSGMPMLTAFNSSDGSTFIYVLYKSI